MGYKIDVVKSKVLQPVVHTVFSVSSDKVLGVDVSRWQGLMDWEKCFNAGAKYAFIRAGSVDSYTGVNYKDVYFDINSSVAYQYMPVGYYWFFRPNYSPTSQADYFTRLIENTERKLPAVCDIEVDGGLNNYYVEKNTKIFCDRLEYNLGEKPLIYTSQGFWHGSIDCAVNVPTWAVRLDLWVANFTVYPTPAMPITWSEKGWTFWQWSADGNLRGPEFGAESKSIDLDYFNGSYEDFLKYIKDGGVVPPPGNGGNIVTVEGKLLKVLVSSLRIRNGPGTNYSIVGGLTTGDQPVELSTTKDSYGNDWSNIGWKQWAAKLYNGIKYMEYVRDE